MDDERSVIGGVEWMCMRDLELILARCFQVFSKPILEEHHCR